ncbi:Protein ZGRF1-like protein [Cladobotryum mycophilum]|uniref:Protein ZGRF1-like protein n=1 Tax=Cladobotryum mycophilum TaxID=491253 RepID=A0ABR0T2Z3_9HYPO
MTISAPASRSIVGDLPDQMVAPACAFPNRDVFIHRHVQGTLIEMANETKILENQNKRGYKFQSWPISPIPGLKTAFVEPWLFLVKTPAQSDQVTFPSTTDRFTIDLESKVERPQGTFTLVHLPATRIPNPYEDHTEVPDLAVRRCAAFKVDVPRSWETKDGDKVELDLMGHFQVASSMDDFSNITLDHNKLQLFTIQWDTFSLTFEAELAALYYFTDVHRIPGMGPSIKAQSAFQMLLSFNGTWKDYYNLHYEYPHLANPADPVNRVPQLILNKFKRFNADHRQAYQGLTRMPFGLYFVNGCPGAGKTEWNMVVSALIHSQKRPGSKKRFSPILFLVDLNETASEAADRYYNLCKDAGLSARVIRMHGWPYEMKNSGKLNNNFLTTAGLARHTKLARNPNKAPTLDEAAWEHFSLHKEKSFKTLRGYVSLLYKNVLSQADFIATTPVAAYGSFSKFFHPDIVFVDEAPHARELTTLIPLAFFEPIAWIFTGDVNQTRPFVRTVNKETAEREKLVFNPYAEQLRLSTMARAEAVNAVNSKLLVNNRAHGNLHRLPSKMFYQSQIVSGLDQTTMYPASTLHLKEYLERLGNGQPIEENRVVVRMRGSQEEKLRESFWNPTHHNWLMDQVQTLLADPKFRSISNPEKLGSILIEAPYRTAFRKYQDEVKKWHKDFQERVQVLTVDKAQGNQADVVFLDMVRTKTVGFMDDRRRLNVAITRARQAEIIIMHAGGTRRGRFMKSEFVSQIWDDAIAQRRMVSI